MGCQANLRENYFYPFHFPNLTNYIHTNIQIYIQIIIVLSIALLTVSQFLILFNYCAKNHILSTLKR